MTKYGETNNFKASAFLGEIENYVGKGNVDMCLVNTEKPKDSAIIERYRKEHVEFVENDFTSNKNNKTKVITGNFLRQGMFLRHDPERLAKKLYEIIK